MLSDWGIFFCPGIRKGKCKWCAISLKSRRYFNGEEKTWGCHPWKRMLSNQQCFGNVSLKFYANLCQRLWRHTIIGPPVLAVIIFEILLNGTSMFNHGNIGISHGIDSLLRLIVVTPDMHRVHHSVVIKETNSNFGFNFPWWDRLFGTYRAQPAAGHDKMVIGLSLFRDEKKLTLPWLLALPFIGNPGRYPILRKRG